MLAAVEMVGFVGSASCLRSSVAPSGFEGSLAQKACFGSDYGCLACPCSEEHCSYPLLVFGEAATDYFGS